MKDITDVSIEAIRDKSYRQECLSPSDKQKILGYLKRGSKGLAGDCSLHDPVTGRIFDRTSTQFTDGEYEWWTMHIYLFEKYNIKLTDEFLEHVAKQNRNTKT